MHIRNKTTLLAIIVFTALYGCDSDDSPASDTSTSMPAPGETPGELVTVAGLDGLWKRACTASASSSEYSSAEMNIAENVATITESYFTDSACSTPASTAVVVTENSLVFDESVTATALGDANNVESTVESKSVDGSNVTEGVNVVTYDLLLLTNNTLYFGDKSAEGSGTTEALRPSTLDQTITWSNL